jgi:hypothetical protein
VHVVCDAARIKTMWQDMALQNSHATLAALNTLKNFKVFKMAKNSWRFSWYSPYSVRFSLTYCITTFRLRGLQLVSL